ncbi:FadR family transcriptional regulator [Schumannella soli]|uniref:FadR family transcriptional regulator n=2 Tax=Schumannella soli TaxID=2590779 RepID=A0A506Y229_9MICO|nr:FadR family transcriptional regulator [Schumannella soli]
MAVQLGLLAPGERLPVPEVAAAALGVSAMSVRRAYRQLDDEGMLRRARGRTGGTFVADDPVSTQPPALAALAAFDDDRDLVHALIDERAAIETGLAVVAAGRADRTDALAELDALVERMSVAVDWADFRDADGRFHRLLAEAARMPAAAELHHRVASELYAYFLPYRIDYLRASNHEHRDILEALRRGDAGALGAAVHAHIVELHESMYVALAQRLEPATEPVSTPTRVSDRG